MLLTIEILAWAVLFILALRGVRWAYAIFLALAFLWIPARTGFHLHQPPCETRFTLDLTLGSLTKYKHVVLWAAFFVMTWRQLRHGRYALTVAGIATIALGVLIELEEGATGTGMCKATDLLPDAVGALIGAGVVALWQRSEARAQEPGTAASSDG